MKKLMLTFLFLSIGSFNFDSALAKDSSSSKLMSRYIEVQEALVADDYASAKNASEKLLKAADKKAYPKLHSELQDLVKAKDIADSRKEFKDVSSILIDKKKDFLGKDMIVAYCPMAGAKWIQKKGEMANPYMGKDMAMCGEKI